LVKFYAPWCLRSQSFGSTWEDIASELKGEAENYVNVARVDCAAHREIGIRFNITGFPTVKMFHKGKLYHYEGKLEANALVQFARGDFKFENSNDVPPELGMFGEVAIIIKHAYHKAIDDFNTGNYFTQDILLMSMPVLFTCALILITSVPFASSTIRKDQSLQSNTLKKRKNLVEPDDDDDDDDDDADQLFVGGVKRINS
jgi:thiol-disulfide isomerase/thioredoxin